MVDLTLHGQSVPTVFNLLGSQENDLTFSLGWAMSQSERLATTLLEDVFPGVDVGRVCAVKLQDFVEGGGFTDIELQKRPRRVGS